MASTAGAGISAAAGDDVTSTGFFRTVRNRGLGTPAFVIAAEPASSDEAASASFPVELARPVRAGISAAACDDVTSADFFRTVRNHLGTPASSFPVRFPMEVAMATGLYFEMGSPDREFFYPIIALFDPIVADALARGDFHLDNIPPPLEAEDAGNWVIMDCQSGYLLLSWPETGDLVVYNPLSGYQWHVASPQFVHYVGTYYLHLGVSPDGPFCIMCVYHNEGSTTELSVFQFGDRWRLFGRFETADPWTNTHRRAVQSGGILFWPYVDREQMFAVDMGDEEAAWVDIPAQTMEFIVAMSDDRCLTDFCDQLLCVRME